MLSTARHLEYPPVFSKYLSMISSAVWALPTERNKANAGIRLFSQPQYTLGMNKLALPFVTFASNFYPNEISIYRFFIASLHYLRRPDINSRQMDL